MDIQCLTNWMDIGLIVLGEKDNGKLTSLYNDTNVLAILVDFGRLDGVTYHFVV